MIPHLASMVTGAGTAAANHLWQSSVFAVAAWLTGLHMRRNREFELLRRLESLAKVRRHIPMLRSADMMEPGIFGIFRPDTMLLSGRRCPYLKRGWRFNHRW
jgi:hypothetical protein